MWTASGRANRKQVPERRPESPARRGPRARHRCPGERRAEQRHGRVADVLVDRAAKPFDGRIDQRKKPSQQGMHILGVQQRGKTGIADEIAEQYRDRTAIALRIGRRRLTSLVVAPTVRRGRPHPPQNRSPPRWQSRNPPQSRQCGAAGRAEFAPLPILECAAAAAQSFETPFCASRRRKRRPQLSRSIEDVIARKRSRRRHSSGETAD